LASFFSSLVGFLVTLTYATRTVRNASLGAISHLFFIVFANVTLSITALCTSRLHPKRPSQTSFILPEFLVYFSGEWFSNLSFCPMAVHVCADTFRCLVFFSLLVAAASHRGPEKRDRTPPPFVGFFPSPLLLLTTDRNDQCGAT
jgi:hypothetical protein